MWTRNLALALLGIVLSGCATYPTEQPPRREGPPPAAFEKPQGAKIVLIVLENKDDKPAKDRAFLGKLASEGRYLSNYYAVAHPSQPNYHAIASGSIEGVDRGDMNVTLSRCHIGKNLASWAVYAEGYPGDKNTCYLGDDKNGYVRKHNPFASYDDINCESETCREKCTSHIKSFAEFASAATSHSLPDFSLVVPNLDSDGHDYNGKHAKGEVDSGKALDFADKWLAEKFEPLLRDEQFKRDVILIVTFDEDDSDYNLFGVYPSNGNKVYASIWGGHVRPGPDVATYYNHYDLHRTIEAILGVDDRRNCPIESGANTPGRRLAPVVIGGIWR